MIGGQGLYSQTPGAFHMYGGAPNLAGYTDPLYGSPFAPVGRGDALGAALGQVPQHLLTLGGILSLTQGISGNRMNLLGRATTPLANMFGFHGMGMMGGMGAHLLAGQAASSFAAGIGQQQDAQRALNQVFGSRDMGGFMGFGASREDANQLAGVIRDMTRSTDLLTSDQEVKNLFQKFNKMKLMQTSRDAKDMMGRFKELVTTVRDISRDLGTTMEGVMPFFEQQVRMGFSDPQEIRRQLRLNRAARSVGIGIDDEQLIGIQQAGAAANRAVGGSGRFGAEAVRRNLMLLSSATEQGFISDQELQDMTGRRGSDAVADLAQQMTMAGRTLMQNTGQGRMLAGILGQTDEAGRFTGRIDMDALTRLRGMSMEQMQEEFARKISTTAGAMSFEAQMQSGMGANMTAELGGDFSKILDVIFQREGAQGRDAQQIILKRLVPSLRGDVARKILEIYENSEGIQQTVDRELRESSLRNRLPSVIEEQFSFGARLSRAARRFGQSAISPIESGGSRFMQSFGEYTDDVAEAFMTGGFGAGLGEVFVSPFRESRLRDASSSDILNNTRVVDPRMLPESLSQEDRLTNLASELRRRNVDNFSQDLMGLYGRDFNRNMILNGGDTQQNLTRAQRDQNRRDAAQNLLQRSGRVSNVSLNREQLRLLSTALNEAGGDLSKFGLSFRRAMDGQRDAADIHDEGALALLRRAVQDGDLGNVTRENAVQMLQNAERQLRRGQLGTVETESEAQTNIEGMFSGDASSFFGMEGTTSFFDESQLGGGILSVEDSHLRGLAKEGGEGHTTISKLLELAQRNDRFGKDLESSAPTEAGAQQLMSAYGSNVLKGLSKEDVLSLIKIRRGVADGEGSMDQLGEFSRRFNQRRQITLSQLLRMKRHSVMSVQGVESLDEKATTALEKFSSGGEIQGVIDLTREDVKDFRGSRIGEALIKAANVDTISTDRLNKLLEEVELDVEGMSDSEKRQQLARSYLLSAAQTTSEARTTQSLQRFQGVERTAQLVAQVSQDVAGMLENTQRSSQQFQASTVQNAQAMRAMTRDLRSKLTNGESPEG